MRPKASAGLVGAITLAFTLWCSDSAHASGSYLTRLSLPFLGAAQLCLQDDRNLSRSGECLAPAAPLSICNPSSIKMTQACGHPRCPAGQAPCSVTVGVGGQLCWFCCPG
jgi:hypothetical protein